VAKKFNDGNMMSPESSGSIWPWVLCILGLAAAAGAGYVAYNERKTRESEADKRVALSTQVKDAETKMRDLNARLETLESERTALTKDVASKDEELNKLKGTYDQLQDRLKSELKSGDVQLTQSGGKLRVDLVDRVLFNSGEAAVNKRGENLLLRVGAILAGIEDKQIQVSGHTDQTPIGEKRSAQFPTNWELSVARATNVVRFLAEKANVPGERLMASGYGEFHPIASNKSSTGRARNRRIEILLTPSLAPKTVSKSKLRAEAQATAKTEAKPPDAEPRRKK
jgi:chemotaxis protein MotB